MDSSDMDSYSDMTFNFVVYKYPSNNFRKIGHIMRDQNIINILYIYINNNKEILLFILTIKIINQ